MLAIIPARGGSKRIERKNVKDFCGKPIIAYSIEAALQSGCFREVMVSTDDPEIARVAREYGAKVPFMRSAKTSDDFATTADVIREVLSSYADKGVQFNAFACIYATAPFVTPSRLREGAEIISEGRGSAAFTCVEYSYPIQRSLQIDDDGRIRMKFPEYANSRSQDLRKSYHDAGQFYFSTVKAFEESGSLWGPDTLPIVLPELEVQDLDTLQDWQIAEMKFRLSSHPQPLPFRFKTRDFSFVSYFLLSEEMNELLRCGRNEPDVRQNSVNQEEISAESHHKFIGSLSANTSARYYAVFDHDGNLIGSINLHVIEPDTLERGVWICADRRGAGMAKQILLQVYRKLSEWNYRKVVTEVRNFNEASHRLEKALGAIETGRDSEYTYYALELR